MRCAEMANASKSCESRRSWALVERRYLALRGFANRCGEIFPRALSRLWLNSVRALRQLEQISIN